MNKYKGAIKGYLLLLLVLMKENLNQELIYKAAIFDRKTTITEIKPVVYIFKKLVHESFTSST